MCESVCYYFIENLDNKEHSAFVINFLIDNFKEYISETVMERLKRTLEGCQVNLIFDYAELLIAQSNLIELGSPMSTFQTSPIL